MQIAIVGAGFSGLAACWNLLQHPALGKRIKVVVFDEGGIGAGSSGMAAGLMHPYVGVHAKLNWMGIQGIAATQKLLDVASAAQGKAVANYCGILRLALSASQESDYKRCAAIHTAEVEWWDSQRCQALVPGLGGSPGLFIKTGASVFCPLYLAGLWKACQALGAVLEIKTVESLQELHAFDAVIVATGALVKAFPELSHLPITPVKGQLLEYAWPAGIEPLPAPLNSVNYLVMSESGGSCFAGATYEREFRSALPDPAFAQAEIGPKIAEMFPPLAAAQVVGCRAGLRASAAQRKPLMGRLDSRIWYLTGMGSKGLLYHALFAESLAAEIATFFAAEYGFPLQSERKTLPPELKVR